MHTVCVYVSVYVCVSGLGAQFFCLLSEYRKYQQILRDLEMTSRPQQPIRALLWSLETQTGVQAYLQGTHSQTLQQTMFKELPKVISCGMSSFVSAADG